MSKARISGHFLLALVTAPLLLGSACEKKQPSDTGAMGAVDRASSTVDQTPLAGIDTTKLDADKQKLFYSLVGSLNSPCGKGESLRASFTKDKTCKRAPFAVKYVLALVEDEAPEASVREQYASKYEPKEPPVKLDTSKAPRIGNDDAPVRIVELYDYGCHVCQEFKPVVDQVIQQHGDKVVFYFLMYPLGKWPDSKSAAQASIAAAQQGKFKEMHAMLFARSPNHNHEAVTGYAKELGLDLDKFEAAYTAAATQIDADHAQGEKVGVPGTPTIFFNDRRYEGPRTQKYLGMWIEEEVAVNR
ncbi:MAG TPA: thioredoxin domain-containing protein [Kofleriaceae bacterium]|nr:thioredoxin domain-containing protein [Kofleriaceae bacterium]